MFETVYSLISNLFYTSKSNNKFYYLSLIHSNNTWHIHGLWPQYDKTCYPTYCKPVTFDINKLDPIIKNLNIYWYSNNDKNELFWKHEYEKHGSCIFTDIDEFEYFNTTLKLYLDALQKKLPEKFKKGNKALIPVNLKFEFI